MAEAVQVGITFSFSSYYVGLKPNSSILLVYGDYCCIGTQDLGKK